MSELAVALVGMAGLALGGVATAWVVRRRTSAEAKHLDADAAKTITEAAGRLVEMVETDYSRRLTDFEGRLHAMSAELSRAQAEAGVAREGEKRCADRLAVVEGELAMLKAQLASLTTTTRTVQTTVVEPHAPPVV